MIGVFVEGCVEWETVHLMVLQTDCLHIFCSSEEGGLSMRQEEGKDLFSVLISIL
jgi:hypothetical protein